MLMDKVFSVLGLCVFGCAYLYVHSQWAAVVDALI